MLPTRQGSFLLFRAFGIDVYLNWTWFLVLLYVFSYERSAYSSSVWIVFEVLGLFAIILAHEFGHALACRQVGGQAELIVLWPFGGVAYVSPPQRPGAVLWSIAAGPLVNVVLTPILFGLWFFARSSGLYDTMPNLYRFIAIISQVNLFLLIFNMMPVYPLDGGQILQSLLWFVVGRARSLMIAASIGLVALGAAIIVALVKMNLWLGLICVIMLMNCWQGLMYARVLARIAKMPHRPGFACPDCHQPPILGAIWRCERCSKPVDPFETGAVCPHCGLHFPVTRCPECGRAHPLHEWITHGTPGTPPGT
jgi:Zn-dependent protease/predicted RNA-binding Zn-ribbon protein involved in translation (DUF1610 family)